MKDEKLEKLSMEALVIKIRDLEADEHVLLARKADAARELLLQRLRDLQREQLRGRTLERLGTSHEYLDRLLEGSEDYA